MNLYVTQTPADIITHKTVTYKLEITCISNAFSVTVCSMQEFETPYHPLFVTASHLWPLDIIFRLITFSLLYHPSNPAPQFLVDFGRRYKQLISDWSKSTSLTTTQRHRRRPHHRPRHHHHRPRRHHRHQHHSRFVVHGCQLSATELFQSPFLVGH